MSDIEGTVIDGNTGEIIPAAGPAANYPAPHRSTQLMQYRREMVVTVEDAKKELERLRDFQRGVMRPGIDFAEIPGTNKPSLLKPGAETLLGAFGYGFTARRTEKVQVDRYADEEKQAKQTSRGWSMAYMVTVTKTLPNGQVVIVAECEGFAGNDEEKWRDAPPNTIAKMAQKRAMVGAALNACAASELFTQDAEDGGMVTGDSSGEAGTTKEHPWSGFKLRFGKFKGKTLEEAHANPAPDGKTFQEWAEGWWFKQPPSDPKYAKKDADEKAMVAAFFEHKRAEGASNEIAPDTTGLGDAPAGDADEEAELDRMFNEAAGAPEPEPAVAVPGMDADVKHKLAEVMMAHGYADSTAAAIAKIDAQITKYGAEQISTEWAQNQIAKIPANAAAKAAEEAAGS